MDFGGLTHRGILRDRTPWKLQRSQDGNHTLSLPSFFRDRPDLNRRHPPMLERSAMLSYDPTFTQPELHRGHLRGAAFTGRSLW